MIFEIVAFKNLSPIEKYLAMATLEALGFAQALKNFLMKDLINFEQSLIKAQKLERFVQTLIS